MPLRGDGEGRVSWVFDPESAAAAERERGWIESSDEQVVPSGGQTIDMYEVPAHPTLPDQIAVVNQDGEDMGTFRTDWELIERTEGGTSTYRTRLHPAP